MSEELLVRHGAPTLAGMKTGSLFSCACDDAAALRGELRRLNRMLAPRGLCLLLLRQADGRALLYLYRPARLRHDLADGGAQALLRQSGYGCESCGRCIAQLIRRLQAGGEFPHEVGLFLSYPPEDVRGFIQNRAEGFRCAGLWKVYGDAERAQAIFQKYRQCTQIYCRLYRAGVSLERLAVAG